jgi:hypothetical protein
MIALPRVTAILDAVGLGPDLTSVSADVLTMALARGTAVHAAIEAHAYGYLDEADITPIIAPYFSAYLKFLADSGHEPIASEIEVIHPAWRYQGHPDRVGWLNGRRVIIDFKSGGAAGAEYQLAAYVEAWNAMRPTEPVTSGLILQLKKDGTYRLTEIELARATQVWLAAVVVYQARHRT